MKRLIFLCFLSMLLLILTCGKSTEPDQGPLFSVKVVDTSGISVANLRVGSINHSTFLSGLGKNSPAPKACPATEITFTLPNAGHYTLRILNYYGQEIRMFDGDSEAGTFVIVWDGHDQDGKPLISGFYRYHLSVVYDEGGSWSDEKWMVLEMAPDAAQTIIGTTDSTGLFATDDTLLFPCLLGAPPPIIRRDELGQVIDTVYDFYEDTVTITLSDSAEPDKFLYFVRSLKVGTNYFKLVWDPTEAF